MRRRLRSAAGGLRRLLRRPPPVLAAAAALRVEHDRDRTVVGELDGHAGAEDAPRNGHADAGKGGAEGVIERLGLVGGGGPREARGVTLSRVGGEREMT